LAQNLGAKHPDRAEQSVWRAGFFNMIFLGAVSLVFLLLAPKLVGIFSADPLVIKFGADCLRIIANEAQEPVRGEFKTIVESQQVGIPMGEACQKLYERMPLPEANFFGIVVGIQQKSGGNLSEALANLSRVLRDRKKMKAKIQAMSMEAKASAVIIAALPFCVMILVYITSPNYIELLWTHPTGRMMMACSAAWMLMGVFVMKR
jgi:tight adherence protein B